MLVTECVVPGPVMQQAGKVRRSDASHLAFLSCRTSPALSATAQEVCRMGYCWSYIAVVDVSGIQLPAETE